MERLIGNGASTILQTYWQNYGANIGWKLRRLVREITRRYGVSGWSMIAMAIVGTILLVVWLAQLQQLNDLAQRRDLLRTTAVLQVEAPRGFAGTDARGRLQLFANQLLPHEEIPQVLQDVLRQAEDEGLAIQRGEYRAQIDSQGEFLRYRMSLPVSGKAAAINRFIKAALIQHRSLALESIQFKRDRMEAGDIEARLQWTVMTRLPAVSARLPAASAAFREVP